MRKSFELRTLRTPLNPSRLRALWTFSPSGSVTPFFSRTSTRTWTIPMRPRCGKGSVLLALFGNGPEVISEEGEPRRRSDDHGAVVPVEFDQAFGRKRTDRAEHGATGEPLGGDRGHEPIVPNWAVKRESNRTLRGRERRDEAHASEHRQSHRIGVAIPRLDSFLERRQYRRAGEDLRTSARADSDGAVPRGATNRPPDRLEGIRQVEGVDADGMESRFEDLEAAEPRRPECLSAGHEDKSVVG